MALICNPEPRLLNSGSATGTELSGSHPVLDDTTAHAAFYGICSKYYGNTCTDGAQFLYGYTKNATTGTTITPNPSTWSTGNIATTGLSSLTTSNGAAYAYCDYGYFPDHICASPTATDCNSGSLSPSPPGMPATDAMVQLSCVAYTLAATTTTTSTTSITTTTTPTTTAMTTATTTATSTATSTPTWTTVPPKKKEAKLSAGALAGVIVGSVAGAALIGGVGYGVATGAVGGMASWPAFQRMPLAADSAM